MVAYAFIVYLVSLFGVLFTYTILWDIYMGFWTIANQFIPNTSVMGWFHTIHVWIPALYLFSATFWYLAQSQRRQL